MILDNFDRFFFYNGEKSRFHKCCFLTDFDQSKNYALFRNNHIQRNIRKHNQSFEYGNRFRFIFGLKTSFEMSEGRLNVSLFLWKTNN